MENWKNDRVGSCERGENPMVIARMPSGFAVIGDNQFLPGYCLLLASPRADSLNALPPAVRIQFLADMALIGDAILAACRPLRINYSILMNADHYLHAHIEARYDWEPDAYKRGPSYLYPPEERNDPRHAYEEFKHGETRRAIAGALQTLMRLS